MEGCVWEGVVSMCGGEKGRRGAKGVFERFEDLGRGGGFRARRGGRE